MIKVSNQSKEKTIKFTLNDYRTASASELASLIRQGITTPEKLINFALEVIEMTNKDLNNVISLRVAQAKEEAAALTDTGQPFYGVPLLIKGLGHELKGESNTLGINFLQDQTFEETSEYISALQQAGFIIIGQTSYPQMGWINVTNSDLYGDTHNPWDLKHNPGGSSGGAAAAVVTGQVPIATTSDSGGSTRIPASFSGLIGLHPTQGILQGNLPEGQTSHFAIMKEMKDVKNLFETLLVEEAKNLMTNPNEILSKETKIAYTFITPAGTPISDEAVEAVQKAVSFMESQGFTLVEVDYPIDGKKMMEDYYTLAATSTESLDNLAQIYLKRNLEQKDVELLTWGLYQFNEILEEEDIRKAEENLARVREKLRAFYDKYPIFITATTAHPAPPTDYHHLPAELITLMKDMSFLTKKERADLIYNQWLPAWTLTPYTQLSNLTGTPSISLPIHLTEKGLPLGVLFQSGKYQDRLLLQVGEMFEENNLFIDYFKRKELLNN